MKEWQRTIILVVLIALAVAFIIWIKTNYQQNFLNRF